MKRQLTPRPSPRPLYRTREFADLAGVTVRALHHYDRLGLLTPSRRDQSGCRRYSRQDLARLEQIVVLKFIGLSLEEIGELLPQGSSALPEILRKQEQVLTEKRRQLDRAIRAIAKARRSIGRGEEADWGILLTMVKEIDMQSNNVWMRKYFSEEANAKIEQLQGSLSWTAGSCEHGMEPAIPRY